MATVFHSFGIQIAQHTSQDNRKSRNCQTFPATNSECPLHKVKQAVTLHRSIFLQWLAKPQPLRVYASPRPSGGPVATGSALWLYVLPLQFFFFWSPDDCLFGSLRAQTMSNLTYEEQLREAMVDLREQLTQDEKVREDKLPRDKMLQLQYFMQNWSAMYIRYLQIFRRLEDCYDQILQPQKRADVRIILDSCIGRLLELKFQIVSHCGEYVNYDDVLVDLKLTPDVLEIPIPRCTGPADALEGKGPQRRPRKRLGKWLEEVAKAVGGGWCRLQLQCKPALAVRETVGGQPDIGSPRGGAGVPLPFNASLTGPIRRLCPPSR